MILGRVIGQVWAARRDPRLQRAKLLVVRPHAIYEPAFAGRHLVATDDVDAGVGDDVIVCLGAPRARRRAAIDMPVDAAVWASSIASSWRRTCWRRRARRPASAASWRPSRKLGRSAATGARR
jgi:ethanolamine utilization protein EutN